jgi:hypothetical protein
VAKKTKTAKKTGSRKKSSAKKPAARKAARASAGTKPRRTVSRTTPAGALKLSALRAQIDRALKQIDIVAAKEPGRYDETRARLARWADDIDDICNPDNPFGCGPIMVFPA